MSIKAAVDRLQNGEIVAIPAEGVYGYSVDAMNTRALEKLLAYKGRDQGKGLIVLIAGMNQLQELCPPLSETAMTKLRELWAPGQTPITVILPALPTMPELLTGGRGTIAVRLPQVEDLLALLEEFGAPLVSTSANKSGEPAIYEMADLPPELYALETTRTLTGAVSRIYDLANDRFLR